MNLFFYNVSWSIPIYLHDAVAANMSLTADKGHGVICSFFQHLMRLMNNHGKGITKQQLLSQAVSHHI